MKDSIPKIIHYCWFGSKNKPKYIIKYINEWKAKLPEYQIIEWNENNFDINYCKYSKEAYDEKKYAFVSDVARLYALYNYGGIYLDTDVEIVRSFDNIIKNKEIIFGFEEGERIATSFIASTPHNKVIYEFLNVYHNLPFILETDKYNLIPNVEYLTSILKEKGLKENGEFQLLENYIYIYPKEYFSPYDYINCVDEVTSNTYCIHHFAVSWLNKSTIIKKNLKTFFVRIFGKEKLIFLRKVKNKVKER